MTLATPMMKTIIWLVLGVVLGGAFLAFARRTPRAERRILATGLVVASLVYVGFALVQTTILWLLIELLGAAIYGVIAWLGLRHSTWWLAAGWALHPLWDVGLHVWGAGRAFAPMWYAVACISFDILVAGYVVLRFHGRRRGAV